MAAEIALKVNDTDYDQTPLKLSATLSNLSKADPIKVTPQITLQASVASVKGLKLAPGPLEYTSLDGKPDLSKNLDASHFILDKKNAVDVDINQKAVLNISLSGVQAEGKYTTKLTLSSVGNTIRPAEIAMEITISKASAQTIPSQITTLSVISPEIAVFATQGDTSSIVDLTLHAGGTTVSNITLASVDLRSTDKIHIFPASNILFGINDTASPKMSPVSIETNKDVTQPIYFKIGNAPCGQYAGSMYVRFGHDSSLNVPISVNVRIGWEWPLFTVFTGSGLSFLIAWYRGRQLASDQIMVDEAKFRSQINEEPAFKQGNPPIGAAFLQNINQNIVAIGIQLDAAQWDAARQSLDSARVLWLKWQQNREDWLQQFTRLAQTRTVLAAQSGTLTTNYLIILRYKLDDAERQSPQKLPSDLRDVLNPLRNQLDAYVDLQTDFKRLDNAITLLPEETQAERQRKQTLTVNAHDLRQNLDNLDPSQMTLTLHNDQKTDVILKIEEATGAPIQDTIAAAVSPKLLDPVVNVPALGPQVLLQAKRRLITYNWGIYLFAIIVTTIGGFLALYVANPVFGSSPFRDCFSLFLWGFGADQVSRATITSTITNVGIPTSKELNAMIQTILKQSYKCLLFL